MNSGSSETSKPAKFLVSFFSGRTASWHGFETSEDAQRYCESLAAQGISSDLVVTEYGKQEGAVLRD
jgi:hypothetical protein